MRVASQIEAPPAFAGRNGEPEGFFVDVMKEASRRAGISIEWRFGEAMEALLSREEADVWAAVSSTPGRRKAFYFSKPWWLYDYYLVVPASGPAKSVSDLRGKTIAVASGPPLAVDLRESFPGADFRKRIAVEEAIRQVCTNSAGAALINSQGLWPLLLHRPPGCESVAFRLIAQPSVVAELSIVTSYTKRHLADSLRDAIGKMITDGSLAAIASQYPLLSSNTAGQMLHAAEQSRRLRLLMLAAVFSILLLVLLTAGLFYRRTSRRRIAEAERRERAAVQAKAEFLAMMSHEMRTPMNALLGYMDMLLETPLRADQRQFAQDVRHSAASLLSMLSDVTDYAKIQSGAVRLNEEPFDPTAIADDATAALLLPAQSKNLEIIVHFSPRLPERLIGDAQRIRQVVVNLLSNALKFTSHGFVRLNLDYESRQEGGQLTIEVIDTGSGIPEEKRELIFEPFSRAVAPEAPVQEGTGLGLAIVSRLVGLMNGTIEVTSATGAGSRFTIRIPLPRPAGARGWLESLGQKEDRTILLLAQPSVNVSILVEYLTHVAQEAIHLESEEQLLKKLEQLGEQGKHVMAVLVEPRALVSSLQSLSAHLRKDASSASAAIIALDSLAALVSLPDEAKEICDAMWSWPIHGRFLRALLAPVPARVRNFGSAPVLVVDDNLINRRMAAALLEKLGCQVETAHDGKLAIEMAARKDYALILMDCLMPGVDGFHAAKAIRNAESGTRRTPIFGLSASTGEETRLLCLQSGMDGYLTKPIDTESLKRTLLQAGALSGLKAEG